MSSFRTRPPVSAEAGAAADAVMALESMLYGDSTYTVADLEAEWQSLDLERDARVVLDGDRIVGYGTLDDRGDLWRVAGFVHPDAHGRGAGAELAAALEREAGSCGARRLQNSILEADVAARRLLEGRGYRPVRVFREMRIELTSAPGLRRWPDGLRLEAFDPERDAHAFHAAHQEAFADAWDWRSRSFDEWSKHNLETDRFDPSLWAVLRAGDEIAAGTINVAGLYGGGWVAVLFTRRPWRGRGVGGGLLRDAFSRFWERGERSVGLSVDAESATGAFRVYEREGMTPTIGWVAYEKELDAHL